MTRRYSGDLTIRILWSDELQTYAAKVKAPDEESVFVTVGAPKVLEHAVDSPEAFDAAAKAAIAFANDDVPGIGERAASKEDGYYIGRSKEARWPCCH